MLETVSKKNTGQAAKPKSLFENLAAIVGEKHVVFDAKTVAHELENALGVSHLSPGIVRPGSVAEVKDLVQLARAHQLPLYPISGGQNIGYGKKSPVSDGQLIVDLQRMNRIREFNDTHGYVVVEPGVTQTQLYQFLQEKHARYWMDATGAGLTSSPLGNTLESGFGHTPKGNRRKMFSEVEVVLGNGTLLSTGRFPGLGPDLSGVFVQSNFGIVTAMRLELMPIPERFESVIIRIQDDALLERFIDAIRELRQNGTLRSLVHLANATRVMMTSVTCPLECENRRISNSEAQQLLGTGIFAAGCWSAAAGLYGTAQEVRAKKRVINKAFRGIGSVTYFSDRSLGFAEGALSLPLIRRNSSIRRLSRHVAAVRIVHQLMQGVPSDEPVQNIAWRSNQAAALGLRWYSPVLPADGNAARQLVSFSDKLFERFGFELPLTMTFVEPHSIIGVISISFNRSNPEQSARALKLYDALKKSLEGIGVDTYRKGIVDMDTMRYKDIGKDQVFAQLKQVLDPHNIIAPGRYGIGRSKNSSGLS